MVVLDGGGEDVWLEGLQACVCQPADLSHESAKLSALVGQFVLEAHVLIQQHHAKAGIDLMDGVCLTRDLFAEVLMQREQVLSWRSMRLEILKVC